ncbi:MAG: translational GTPase TypA [Chloroflexota bacterium]|nr:translational GTPase TypA [Chloroflexota bacterium]
MEPTTNTNIRNLAIIAHVDHGKTTLVDALLKQGRVFREHQEVGELIMDSDPLERERGITILAKNTAVEYRGIKINIIDTPGHADFSGEVERVMNMADGCLLLVDAVDGPMPQTRYVLQQALQRNVTPMVVINKIDRPEARISEVEGMVQDLFLELATQPEQLDFPILYASAKQGFASASPGATEGDMQPLFDSILEVIPPPTGDPKESLRMLVAALDYDNYLGQIAIGRVFTGSVGFRDAVAVIGRDGNPRQESVENVFVHRGLERLATDKALAGEIVAISGIEDISIGDTIAGLDRPEALPSIEIEEPTVMMTFGVNTSPFMGKEGSRCTSRMLRERLFRELRTNVSLRVDETASADEFLVSGRGELHLSILVENMRREGYEFQVSRPAPVTRVVAGKVHEPFEQLTVHTREEYIGALSESLANRLGQMTDMDNDGGGNVRMEYLAPTRGLIGFRSFFLRTTRGNGVTNSRFVEYRPMTGEMKNASSQSLVASEPGVAVTYGLLNAQGRGPTFIEPGTQVYEGMIVGMHPKEDDIVINVCREKKLTNMRSSTADVAKRLSPPVKMSLEEALEFIAGDELVEVTPLNYRLRKRILASGERQKQRNRRREAVAGAGAG